MEIIDQQKEIHQQSFRLHNMKLSEVMFCLCLISIFLPIKIYPVLFLISSFVFYRETKKLLFCNWMIFLSIYSAYAVISFIFSYSGEFFMVTNIIKLLVNFIFLFFAVSWLRSRDNNNLLKAVDIVLHFIFLLVFIQLLVYHHAFNFRLLYGSTSSGQASALYNLDLYFWGIEDKNMFGARIATLGFPYIMVSLIRYSKFSWAKTCWIFLLAYMSLSRTPIVALLIGVFLLLWICSGLKWRLIVVVFMSLTLPFVMQKIIRVDNLTASNDGMGVRLVYWEAFFRNFTEISPLGNGFMSAPEFLAKHAGFYRGEPHIHNTFLTSYLELGILGLVSYCLFFVYFFIECRQKLVNNKFWVIAFLPLLSIMMILYSGYDNDIVIYLTMIYLLGSIKTIDFKNIRMGL